MAESPPPYHPSTLTQWVNRVLSFSTQYNHTSWSANQVIGHPKVYPQHGDIIGAWATAVWDANQFIEVEFEIPVRPTEIHIYETYNPGAVVRVKARRSSSELWVMVWSTERPTHLRQSRIFSPSLSNATKAMMISQLRIEVNCTAARDWCELDAIQLVGIRDGAVGPTDDCQFIDDMKLLVNNELYSDVKFDINNKTVYGHKALLATRSPYFAKMFAIKHNENHATLRLPEVSYEDILAVLHFIYTNRLPDACPFARLVVLCKTSSIFEVPEMKTTAMYKLVGEIKCHNVVGLYNQVQYDPSLDDVKSLCMNYMSSHLKEMSNEPSFSKLPQTVIVAVIQATTMALSLNDSSSTT